MLEPRCGFVSRPKIRSRSSRPCGLGLDLVWSRHVVILVSTLIYFSIVEGRPVPIVPVESKFSHWMLMMLAIPLLQATCSVSVSLCHDSYSVNFQCVRRTSSAIVKRQFGQSRGVRFGFRWFVWEATEVTSWARLLTQ